MQHQKEHKRFKKVSSGLLAKNGVFALDNPSFVEGYYEWLEQTKQEAPNKAIKQQKLINANIKKVQSMQKAPQ